MGSVSLNGTILDHRFEATTILELVAAVEEQFVEQGHIIVEVMVDGRNVTDFTGEDGVLLPYDAAMAIAITARDLHEIMVTSIDEFEKYFDRLIPNLPDVAELFRQGHTFMKQVEELEATGAGDEVKELRAQAQGFLDEANQYYIDVVDGVRVMIELIQGMSGSKTIDFNAPDHAGRSLIELTSGLKETIQSLVDAQTKGENDRIAVLLESNLVTDLVRWRDAFTRVGGQLRARS